MQRKKMTLRFDLDHPEDRQAWEYLQGLNAVSLNRTLVSIINQAAHISLMKDDFRSIIREELAAAMKQLPVQSVELEPGSDNEADDTIMDFLDNFLCRHFAVILFAQQMTTTAFCRHHLKERGVFHAGESAAEQAPSQDRPLGFSRRTGVA